MNTDDRAEVMALLDTQNVILREMRDDIKETKQYAAETNGRVRKLELWQASVQGARAAMGWAGPLLISLASVGAGAVLAKLLGG
jgi:hypothetical protein